MSILLKIHGLAPLIHEDQGVLMMNYRNLLTTTTAIALLTLGATAMASDNGKLVYDNEIESCVNEVLDRANLDDATRVRHLVVKVRRARKGFVFNINTSVFTDSDDVAERVYTTYCIADGNDRPLKFKINEKNG